MHRQTMLIGQINKGISKLIIIQNIFATKTGFSGKTIYIIFIRNCYTYNVPLFVTREHANITSIY